MVPPQSAIIARSPRLEVFTSLLLILFALFKFDRYQPSPLSASAISQQVCEQVETVPPNYDIPQLTCFLLADEDIASVIADGSPPQETMFSIVERIFSEAVALRMRLHEKSLIDPGRPLPFCRPLYTVSPCSDESSDPFSS